MHVKARQKTDRMRKQKWRSLVVRRWKFTSKEVEKILDFGVKFAIDLF